MNDKKRLFVIRRPDTRMLYLTIFLAFVGIIMVHSASVNIGIEEFSDPNHYVKRQAIFFVLGLFSMIFFSNIHYERWRKLAAPLFFVTIFLLFLPLMFPNSEGVKSWVNLGLFSFQTSELAKLSFILFFAAWLERREKVIKHYTTFITFLIILGILSVLIMLQPDFGTLSIIVAIAFTMYFVAGMSIPHLLSFMGLGSFAAYYYISAESYRIQRILTFLNPNSDIEGAGYHLRNIAITVGSGSWWGLGLGNSRQKRLFLPEPHNDSIFAVIVEELGFIRAAILLFIILYFIWRGLTIAAHIKDKYAQLVLAGIISWIFWQSLLNIGAMIGLVPLTGVPLPFISYGGTSLLVLMSAVGVMLNISKYKDG